MDWKCDEDDDNNMDYFNDHLFILQALAALPLLAFDFRNGVFFDEM